MNNGTKLVVMVKGYEPGPAVTYGTTIGLNKWAQWRKPINVNGPPCFSRRYSNRDGRIANIR